MRGKITKGIAGFYYVHTAGQKTYECRAKGIFRKDNIRPLVGDDVEMDVLDESEATGSIRTLFPRKNTLLRPAVANVDQALVIFAVKKPNPNFNLLDRFLVTMQYQDVSTAICFNKTDLATEQEIGQLQEIYRACGRQVFFVSVRREEGMRQLRSFFEGKTTVLAGPSGVGKSALLNLLCPGAQMRTGEISQRIDRGKHTTRHSELFSVGENTYFLDTPGFSSLELPGIEKEDLQRYFAEFQEYAPQCRFHGCMHLKEPDCAVRQALSRGDVNPVRYHNYELLYEELRENRRY